MFSCTFKTSNIHLSSRVWNVNSKEYKNASIQPLTMLGIHSVFDVFTSNYSCKLTASCKLMSEKRKEEDIGIFTICTRVNRETT